MKCCISTRFKGQSYMKYNEDDVKRDFTNQGLKIDQARLAGTTCRGLIKFPSIEGCIYLLRDNGWMTASELSIEDDED